MHQLALACWVIAGLFASAGGSSAGIALLTGRAVFLAWMAIGAIAAIGFALLGGDLW